MHLHRHVPLDVLIIFLLNAVESTRFRVEAVISLMGYGPCIGVIEGWRIWRCIAQLGLKVVYCSEMSLATGKHLEMCCAPI